MGWEQLSRDCRTFLLGLLDAPLPNSSNKQIDDNLATRKKFVHDLLKHRWFDSFFSAINKAEDLQTRIAECEQREASKLSAKQRRRAAFSRNQKSDRQKLIDKTCLLLKY